MAKHHFIVKHNRKRYECYLDETLCLHILNEKGETVGTTRITGISKIEEAKEAARLLLKSYARDRQ